MNTYSEIVTKRRTANKFLPGNQLSKETLNEIFEEVAFAPSCFNLQHTKYYVGLGEKATKAMHEASGQFKVSTGSGVIIVTGDKDAYKKGAEIYEGSKFLKIIDEDEYNYIVNGIKDFHESRGQSFLEDEAIRNASLSAMLFMLSAKDKGWDTAPMIFFDNAKVRDYFHILENEEIVLMIAIGKMDEDSMRVRGYRKPVHEFVTFS